MRTRAIALVTIALCGAVAASAAGQEDQTLVTGQLDGGGTWTLAGEHRGAEPLPAICLHLSATLPDGTSPGQAVACAAGVLHGLHGVMALTATSRSGGHVTTRLLGGLASSRARTVTLTFANGRHRTIATTRAPAGWGVEVSSHVSYFAADLCALSRSSLRRVITYDNHHRRIGATSHIAAPPLR